MAGFFQQFLQGTENGFLDSVYLKDYSHANKTFTRNGFQNAPKFKWLYHVYFSINKFLITNNALAFPDTTNYGLLVKSIELPKFNLGIQECNQYNRKRYVQTKINYEPVRVVFHDDNGNQVRNLWYNYYSYYYNDPSQPMQGQANSAIAVPNGNSVANLNTRNIYDPDISKQKDWGYTGEISDITLNNNLNYKVPFFKSIKIYGFNQHNFALYELINPIVENFTHDSYAYAEDRGTMENSMSIRYESVKYFDGALNGANPSAIVEQFAEPGTYDTRVSPISRPGNNANIMGQGGLVDAGEGILNDLSNGNILGAIQTAGLTARAWKNPQQILQAAQTELLKGAISIVSNPQTVRGAMNFPAMGGNSGTGSQPLNATNANTGYSKPASIPANNPIG